MQRTLARSVEFKGIGLHSGQPVRMRLRPAAADHGIRFLRTDLAGDNLILARWDQARPALLCTCLGNDAGATVSTVEHLLAALAGLGIGNVLVEVDGPELPVLDGSAAPYVRTLLRAGLRAQDAPLRAIEILQEVTVRDGAASASLLPAPGRALTIDFTIDFPVAAIGRQHRRLDMANSAFLHELADSRTFCLARDIDTMQERGRALGGSLANAVVFDQAGVRNLGGLRHADEPVRHKMLDAMGDLALAGAPLLALYRAERAGHALTNRLLHTLFARPEAWRLIACPPALEARLPGAGVLRDALPAVA